MRSLVSVAGVALALALTACGGGGSSPPAPPPPPPPPPPASLAVTYLPQPAFFVGMPIAAVTPTVTGGPASTFTVSPTLPAGLAINAADGIISGTPTAVSATSNYQITASKPGSSTIVTLALTVNDREPEIEYPASWYSLTTQSVVNLRPWTAGGAKVGQFSINHSLPVGLDFDPATGIISGTPTQVGDRSDFLVSIGNTGGVASFSLRIGVVDEVVPGGLLLELGHDSDVSEIVYDGARIASTHGNGTVLWNAQTGEILAKQIHNHCSWECGRRTARLAGNTLVVRGDLGFTVSSAVDGTSIVNSAGTILGSTPFREMGSLQIVPGDLIYTPSFNEVLDATTGNTRWSSVAAGSTIGAVAGNNVVFTDNLATVRMERL